MKTWIKNRFSERSTRIAIVGLISGIVAWKTHDTELSSLVSSAMLILIGVTPESSK